MFLGGSGQGLESATETLFYGPQNYRLCFYLAFATGSMGPTLLTFTIVSTMICPSTNKQNINLSNKCLKL